MRPKSSGPCPPHAEANRPARGGPVDPEDRPALALRSQDQLSSVAYVESLGGALYIEAPRVENFQRAWEDLWNGALDRRRSNALVKAVLKET
ncbi:Scr1 family TA system antitoxin-like transcriptional regulator [Glycomyces sp. TRM65418]|uniref:Scr1 family TA system antitoxin-like transcriptional regulator n=1 Tax=Glycomyces sp. TRM65418 TaxID=2867006 RepID=UPI001CE50760|nr:Scr1 family TA system antitoxin-like transcriptional regulator [Glycomyces sp. TRM65418]QZD54044.1 hypothetical protein K3N28_14890 [Glycomyces sp. TRM65418]